MENTELLREILQEQAGKKLPEAVSTRFGLVERGTLQINSLRRAAIIVLYPQNDSSEFKSDIKAVLKKRRDPIKLVRHYLTFFDTRMLDSLAVLERHFGNGRGE